MISKHLLLIESYLNRCKCFLNTSIKTVKCGICTPKKKTLRKKIT